MLLASYLTGNLFLTNVNCYISHPYYRYIIIIIIIINTNITTLNIFIFINIVILKFLINKFVLHNSKLYLSVYAIESCFH